MKYIITESRLGELKLSYLNAPDYEIVGGKHVGELILMVNDVPMFLYDYSDKSLTVSNDFIFGFISLFNLDGEETLNYLGDWFEDKFNLNVRGIVNMNMK